MNNANFVVSYGNFVQSNSSWYKAGPDLVSEIADADGDAITEVRIRDTNTDPNSGYFWAGSTGTVTDLSLIHI